jgi:hypothetical protein
MIAIQAFGQLDCAEVQSYLLIWVFQFGDGRVNKISKFRHRHHGGGTGREGGNGD